METWIGGLMIMISAFTMASSKETAAMSDERQILNHIDAIFRAYIEQDRDSIARLHTSDWIGFQGPSRGIERGIGAYMENAERSLAAFRGTGYEMLDREVQIFGELALVWYVARYDYRSVADGSPGSITLRSVDVYRKTDGVWNQSGSHITVVPTGGKWGEQD